MDKYQESKNRYLKEKVENLMIRVPKGQKLAIQEFAKSKGKSINGFVVELITKAMNDN